MKRQTALLASAAISAAVLGMTVTASAVSGSEMFGLNRHVKGETGVVYGDDTEEVADTDLLDLTVVRVVGDRVVVMTPSAPVDEPATPSDDVIPKGSDDNGGVQGDDSADDDSDDSDGDDESDDSGFESDDDESDDHESDDHGDDESDDHGDDESDDHGDDESDDHGDDESDDHGDDESEDDGDDD